MAVIMRVTIWVFVNDDFSIREIMHDVVCKGTDLIMRFTKGDFRVNFDIETDMQNHARFTGAKIMKAQNIWMAPNNLNDFIAHSLWQLSISQHINCGQANF